MKSLERYLTAPFKQRDPVGRMFPDDHAARTGICFGLCLEWMKRHRTHKGESSQDRIDYIGSWSTIMHANIKQRLYSAENKGMAHELGLKYVFSDEWAPQTDAKNAALAEGGMAISTTRLEKVDVSRAKSITQAVNAVKSGANSTHQYTLIGFSLEKRGGGHATCGYKSGGKFAGIGSHFYYFEPNFGEFKVSGGDMTNLFKALIDAYRHYETVDGDIVDRKIQKFYIQKIEFKS